MRSNHRLIVVLAGPRVHPFLLVFVFLSVPVVPGRALAGRLDEARREIRSSASSSARDKDDEDDRYDGSGSEVDPGTVVDILLAPWRVPYNLVDRGRHIDYRFALHPYTGGASGYLRAKDGKDRNRTSLREHLAFRLHGDASYQMDGLWRGAAGARVFLPLRMELDSEWRIYHEDLQGEASDAAVIGNAHLCYRFAQSERAQFRTGAGYQQWSDQEGSEYGIDFTYGFDLFPGNPWIISADAGLGLLGTAFVARFRASVGIAIGLLEITAGYEHVDIEGVALSGPLLGTRVWF